LHLILIICAIAYSPANRSGFALILEVEYTSIVQ
jgi:hypothetical protein